MSELQEVKMWIGIENTDTSQDSLLTALLNRAEDIIKSFSRQPEKYIYLKLEAVIFAYNQRGAEGNKSQSSGGFSTSWYYETMSKFIRSNMPARYVIK